MESRRILGECERKRLKACLVATGGVCKAAMAVGIPADRLSRVLGGYEGIRESELTRMADYLRNQESVLSALPQWAKEVGRE